MDIKNEVQVVTNAIKNDPELYYAYQASIAMAFKDEWSNHNNDPSMRLLVHEVANQAAKNFLDLWINHPRKED